LNHTGLNEGWMRRARLNSAIQDACRAFIDDDVSLSANLHSHLRQAFELALI